VRRRDFLKALSCLSAATLWPALRRLSAALQAPDTPKTLAFSASDVQRQARALAAEKFVPPKLDLPRQWQELGYEQYRDMWTGDLEQQGGMALASQARLGQVGEQARSPARTRRSADVGWHAHGRDYNGRTPVYRNQWRGLYGP